MAYTITDLNNSYEHFNYNNSHENTDKYLNNYWEEPIQHEQKNKNTKKKISFNDILTNMNLIVNKNGELQRINLKQTQPNQQPQYQQPQNRKEEPLRPELTQSYIYNKYFKDYARVNNEPIVPRIPKTIEEYKQMLLEDKIKAIEHKKKIEQIKPKKMMFTTAPNVINHPSNIQVSKNNLKMMSFR